MTKKQVEVRQIHGNGEESGIGLTSTCDLQTAPVHLFASSPSAGHGCWDTGQHKGPVQ